MSKSINKFNISELKKFLSSDEKDFKIKKRKIAQSEIHTLNSVVKKSRNNDLKLGRNTHFSENVVNVHDKKPNEQKNVSSFNGKIPKATKNDNQKSFESTLENQLNSASFRILNEKLYTSKSKQSKEMFQSDPSSFQIYHEGFKSQVALWPVNPINLIISWLHKKPRDWKVGDFGCGDALISKSVQQKVFSFDLVARNSKVIQCDMANVPLDSNSLNVVVFCLSLMGTNMKDYIIEANRVLAQRGVLKIAEVESRFENLSSFLKVMSQLGFKCIHKNQQNNYFWLFDFLKTSDVNLKSSTQDIFLKPCLYKKR